MTANAPPPVCPDCRRTLGWRVRLSDLPQIRSCRCGVQLYLYLRSSNPTKYRARALRTDADILNGWAAVRTARGSFRKGTTA